MGRKRRKNRWKRAADWLTGRGTKRVCIACLGQFWQPGVEVNLMEQFCGEKCKAAFFKGYDLGLKVNGQVSRWPRMGGFASIVEDRK